MTTNMVARMRTHRRTSKVLGCAVVGALALGGCGSSATRTVSVSSAPGLAHTTDAQTTPSTAPRAATTTPSTPSATTPGGAEATRTTTAPAFTKQAGAGGGLNGALTVVRAHGYTANDTSDYHSGQTLRVLVATRTGSGDGYAQQAFFFVGGRYIGTDASQPSAGVKVVGQSDTEVTLAYPLYRPKDPLCCPGGGQATVHFQLNNGRLVALNPIPPASSSTSLSRG